MVPAKEAPVDDDARSPDALPVALDSAKITISFATLRAQCTIRAHIRIRLRIRARTQFSYSQGRRVSRPAAC